VQLLQRGVQTITFTRTRIVAELLYRYAAESLGRLSPLLAQRIRAYRAGYLPEERREIERRLFAGELLGLTSTNALELGIDVGSLQAALIVSYPGSIASTWQQAGRAGRGAEESLVILIAYNEPLDQFLMQRPEFLFGRSPEHAVVDPENPYLLAGHLQCAAFELPLRAEDALLFGPQTTAIADLLEGTGAVKRIDRSWYWSSTEYPAADVSLRSISDANYAIQDTSNGNRVIGTVDAISAPESVYPGGVYLHDAETYLVRKLDLEARIAYVERADVDYYTQAVLNHSVRAGEVQATRDATRGRAHFGDATVTWRTTAFRKVRFYSQESLGQTRLDLPPQHLETTACWFLPSPEALALPGRHGLKAIEGLMGIRNVAVNMLPLVAMCDRLDVGGLVDSSNFGTPAMFLYDRYPKGLGFAEKGYELFEELLGHCLATITACSCEEGCPSCVGLPITRPAQESDLDLGGGYPIPSKEAALVLMHHLLGREPYVPRPTPRRRAAVRSPRSAPPPPADAPRDVSVAEEVNRRVRGPKRPWVGL
jgi:DEAD/DEAH box helicase domain-containing protein